MRALTVLFPLFLLGQPLKTAEAQNLPGIPGEMKSPMERAFSGHLLDVDNANRTSRQLLSSALTNSSGTSNGILSLCPTLIEVLGRVLNLLGCDGFCSGNSGGNNGNVNPGNNNGYSGNNDPGLVIALLQALLGGGGGGGGVGGSFPIKNCGDQIGGSNAIINKLIDLIGKAFLESQKCCPVNPGTPVPGINPGGYNPQPLPYPSTSVVYPNQFAQNLVY